MVRRTLLLVALLVQGVALGAESAPTIRLANGPALSPDGQVLAFSWDGDIWVAPTTGGAARRVTRHPGRDSGPRFSPDGKQIAFIGDREGGRQVYIMPAEGGPARQVTFHTSGYALEGWYPDGTALLVSASRDHHWRHAERFFRTRLDQREADALLFDDYGENGALAPDGSRLLFTREGTSWWRKGYHGPLDDQIWLHDLESKTFTKLLAPEGGARWPLWRPDGRGFYYVAVSRGAFNLHEYDLDSGTGKPLTSFEDDAVVFPCLSRDGSTLVFRHLFDLYSFKPAAGGPPVKIELTAPEDTHRALVDRRVLSTATDAAFTRDGLQVALIAGGDLWVMDTELREPRQVTATPEEEREPVFAPDGESLYVVSDQGGQTDIHRVRRKRPEDYWWRNAAFDLEPVTRDAEVESELKFSPDGSRFGFRRGQGELWVGSGAARDLKRLHKARAIESFDFAPDGKWVVFDESDDDYNSDIWLLPVEGDAKPFNLSRHPDSESGPVWSPDGKLIAFTGRRVGTEIDVHYVWLQEEDAERQTRERTLERALEKMKKGPTRGPRPDPGVTGPAGDPFNAARPGGPGRPRGPRPDDAADQAAQDEPARPEEAKPADPHTRRTEPPHVVIDFDRIHERIRRVSLPNSNEGNLYWSPDSRKLAFTALIDGRSGTYTIELPDNPRPTFLAAVSVRQPRWLDAGNQIVGLIGGAPASLAPAGRETTYRFQARQTVDLPQRNRAAFELAWRILRDRYYDERLGNRNWDEVRRKYAELAAESVDAEMLTTVMQLMLGELNGSHLGFTASSSRAFPTFDPNPNPNPNPISVPPSEPGPPSPRSWSVSTAHLGARFVDGYKGPGLLVRDVLPDSPADHKATRIKPGEIVLAIDGTSVDPRMDLTTLLNGPLDRDVRLTVRDEKGNEREVVIRPITTSVAQLLLYNKWVKDSRALVEKLSDGRLGYLHIRGMNMPSFYQFEEDLYAAGAGKEGLIIDVRENGGGSTTDHLLTALTQPRHAITVGRGGGPGYPQDRMIYAVWQKPIVVLCNQNSFSNAEIFSHAIKTLKRGKLVGVPTAGGVISTGSAAVMDIGSIRLPNRGWYVLGTGEDMELNGAVPDVVLWPQPGEVPAGKDVQLEKAAEVLLADVEALKKQPQPPLRKASERGLKQDVTGGE